jgi:ABC-2 type transport system ATP-binding protein
MTTPAILAEGIHKTYGGLFGRRQRALSGVDLNVERGAAFGLIGPNGAGKTSFIKILLGIARPGSGRMQLLGRDPDDVAARRLVGYLPERLHLPHAWVPPAFLASVARLKGAPADATSMMSLLHRVGLANDANRKIGGFSKGMRQRLGLAAALIGAPELLVLDEPTDGIDPIGRVEVRKILTDELDRGATIFLNSHLLAEVERVCGRVGILSAGKLVKEGTLDELRRSASHHRLRFADGANPEALRRAGFAEGATPGTWRVQAANPGELNEALDRARREGALLVELVPEEKDLEQVLQEVVRRPGDAT